MLQFRFRIGRVSFLTQPAQLLRRSTRELWSPLLSFGAFCFRGETNTDRDFEGPLRTCSESRRWSSVSHKSMDQSSEFNRLNECR